MKLRFLACALAFVWAIPLHAGIEPTPFIDWNQAFLLQGSNPFGDDPRVIFGFDPQPDPPVSSRKFLDLGTPASPKIMHRGTFGPGQAFDVYIGLLLPAVQLILTHEGRLPPGPVSTLALVARTPSGEKAFDVFLDFETSSGGVMDGASAVAFNPQPDPPREFGADSDFGMSFTFTSFSDVSVALRVQDAQGNAVAFARAPEPGTLLLLGVGLAGMGLLRRKRRATSYTGREN